ncbi:MAG: right-handed parallel beta-helix repeat-containing protein [Propionibacteriaceae bacterium]
MRPRRLSAVALAACLGLSLVGAPGVAVGDEPSPDPAPAASETAGSLPPGEASYPVPGDAVVVAPTGSDEAAGTLAAPLRTVTAALARADSGDTIVLRGGAYHEKVNVSKQVTIQNHPGEEVWFDGSTVLDDFTATSGHWRLDDWNHEFDSSPTYSWGAADHEEEGWGFVNEDHPMAAHPDQVWVDGVAQAQVGSVDEVTDGTFYIDDARDRIHLGTDPTGKEVRASSIARAIEVRAEGTVLRGVGIRRYAPSVPHMGTVTAERDDVTIENVAITDNATTGLSILGADAQVTDVTLARNGLLGLHGNNSDNLTVSGLHTSGNNAERFNSSPVSGGMKVTRARGVTISESVSEQNFGPGFWIDESVHDAKFLNNTSRDNTGHGISLEISATMTVAGNVIARNGGFGVKINNTSSVSVWNNTFLDNDRPVNIVQDDRRASDPNSPGRDPRHPNDPEMTWITKPVRVSNNVISGSTGNCLLCVEDYSKEYSAEDLGVVANGNVYQRDKASAPNWLAVWSKGAGHPSVHDNLADFRAATGQEARSQELTGSEAVGPGDRTTDAVRHGDVALPLPESIAELVGQEAGTQRVGAFE